MSSVITSTPEVLVMLYAFYAEILQAQRIFQMAFVGNDSTQRESRR